MARSDEIMERQRERDVQERQLRDQEEERRREYGPGPRVLSTPREEVEAYIRSAVECLRRNRGRGVDMFAGRGPDIPAALRWLDQAREVVTSPNVVDGAHMVRASLREALELLDGGERLRPMAKIEEALELLDRQVRVAGVEVPTEPIEMSDAARQREAVRAVLLRENMIKAELLPDRVLDEVLAAAETGI